MNDIGVILLGGVRKGFTVVDAKDFPLLNHFKWVMDGEGYVRRNVWDKLKKRPRTERLSRKITMVKPGVEVDHRNGIRMDNTRRNLRPATRKQNGKNLRKCLNTTSRFKGVHWNKRSQKWHATIVTNRKSTWLGFFESETEAATAYNKAAIKLHGKFASLNTIN